MHVGRKLNWSLPSGAHIYVHMHMLFYIQMFANFEIIKKSGIFFIGETYFISSIRNKIGNEI